MPEWLLWLICFVIGGLIACLRFWDFFLFLYCGYMMTRKPKVAKQNKLRKVFRFVWYEVVLFLLCIAAFIICIKIFVWFFQW